MYTDKNLSTALFVYIKHLPNLLKNDHNIRSFKSLKAYLVFILACYTGRYKTPPVMPIRNKKPRYSCKKNGDSHSVTFPSNTFKRGRDIKLLYYFDYYIYHYS